MTETGQRRTKRRNIASPRKPQRKNGREKYRKLLDALEKLTESEETVDLTLAHLSQAAGVPAASVYHFFPSVDAALTALAERHFDALFLSLSPLDPDTDSWQELLCQLCDLARQYYACNPPALKAHFGPTASRALRELKIENNWRLADMLLHGFQQPDPRLSRDWRERLMRAIHINESFWFLSYARFGLISDELATDGKRAAAAYLKLCNAEPEPSGTTIPV